MTILKYTFDRTI